jgi:hypothetical protein
MSLVTRNPRHQDYFLRIQIKGFSESQGKYGTNNLCRRDTEFYIPLGLKNFDKGHVAQRIVAVKNKFLIDQTIIVAATEYKESGHYSDYRDNRTAAEIAQRKMESIFMDGSRSFYNKSLHQVNIDAFFRRAFADDYMEIEYSIVHIPYYKSAEDFFNVYTPSRISYPFQSSTQGAEMVATLHLPDEVRPLGVFYSGVSTDKYETLTYQSQPWPNS